ncbi:uncharacterized protein [Magallana gigas]|uniref:uncharacterized protein isoform X1 n=1 Tax=Magallana gigas TaxID=29159 RepID=UPI00333E940E
MMLLLTCLSSALVLITCQTEFTPLTYVYYSERRNWNDASQTCAQTDGMLARFPDVSTVMDILEELPAIKNITVWNNIKDTNPNGQPWNYCSTITLNSNRTMSLFPCQQALPFMCQYQKGQCRYRIYEQNMIQSNDVLTITAIMWQRCHDLCETVTEITCRSFEYNPGSQYCQLSDTNRWRETNQFAFNVPSWDYYHKSCVTALLQQEYTTTTPSRPITSSMTSPVSIETNTTKSKVKSEAPQPLRILKYDNLLSWPRAKEFCQSKGGSLIVLNDKSIIPEANLTSSDNLETLWIGLSREENKDWSWINGDQPNVSHWKYEPKEYDTSHKCASVALKSPYWWYEGFCYEAKPFICQFREDICRYQKEVASVIVSHNKLVLANTTLSECYHVCNSSTQVTCRSFEYNAENQVCQISDVNRWTESQYFLQDVRGWDYYHRKCYFGIDDFLLSTTTKALPTTIVTTEELTDPSTQSQTTTETTFEVIQRELVELGTKIREKKRLASKQSVIDTRPSATSVGVVAVVIIVSMVGGVVLLDIGTLHLHCQHFARRKKKKRQKHNYIKEHESDCNNSTYVAGNTFCDRCGHRLTRDSSEQSKQNTGTSNLEDIKCAFNSNEDILLNESKNNNVENPYNDNDTQL